MKRSFFICIVIFVFSIGIFVNLKHRKEDATQTVMYFLKHKGLERMYDELPDAEKWKVVGTNSLKEKKEQIIKSHVYEVTNYKKIRQTSYLGLLVLFIFFVLNIKKGILYLKMQKITFSKIKKILPILLLGIVVFQALILITPESWIAIGGLITCTVAGVKFYVNAFRQDIIQNLGYKNFHESMDKFVIPGIITFSIGFFQLFIF